jgi:hypothetical protein
VRSRFGRIGRLTILLALVVACLIVTGLIVPGGTGTIVEAVGWGALALLILAKIGLIVSPFGNYFPNDRRPR